MFLDRVIDCLNQDNFLRNYKERYFSDTWAMDIDADKIRSFNQGWSVSTFDCILFTGISLERGHVKVPLTWKEKRRLLKAFNGAMKRLRADRKAYLKSLRN